MIPSDQRKSELFIWVSKFLVIRPRTLFYTHFESTVGSEYSRADQICGG